MTGVLVTRRAENFRKGDFVKISHNGSSCEMLEIMENSNAAISTVKAKPASGDQTKEYFKVHLFRDVECILQGIMERRKQIAAAQKIGAGRCPRRRYKK